jgi:hypothetical protein
MNIETVNSSSMWPGAMIEPERWFKPEEQAGADAAPANEAESASSEALPRTLSKKEHILAAYRSGMTDIAELVSETGSRPSYIAQVLQQAGLLTGYFDLYTNTSREQNFYSKFFRNVLAFKNAQAAQESIRRIDRLYNYFERIGDRAGQHHAMVLALMGKNRARWSGKREAAKIFSDWLAEH